MGQMFEVEGNRLRLLTEGPERLTALLALIDGAERSLRLLFYIYTDSAAGRTIRERLIAAARRGVAVALIIDGMGSEPAAVADFFAPLGAAGVRVCRFTPRWGRRYLLRNHQKLVLADERRAIVGGFNIDDDYFGTAERQAWRDLGLAIEGTRAMQLAGYFDALADWTEQERAPLRALTRTLRRWSEPAGAVRWLFGGPTRRLSPWTRALRLDMRTCRRLDLIAGYFAPNPAMLRRLDRTARRGRVRLVLPARTDHQIAVEASRFTYAGLLRRGVAIYEYQRTKLHTKLVVVDDAVYIGSANFDIRSLYLNLELMLRVEDRAFAEHLRAYVEGEVAQSRRIELHEHQRAAGWWTRIRRAVAYFVMATLDLRLTRRIMGED